MNETKARVIKWILVLAAAAVISPVIFLAVKGLVGLALAAIVGLAIVNFAPVLSLKMANWKLLALKGEARSKPIETRQKLAIDARKRIRAADEAYTEFIAEVKTFSDQVRTLPPEDQQDFATQLAALVAAKESKRQAIDRSRSETLAFEAATARAAAKWKVALAGRRMSKLLGATDTAALDKILAEEAIDSVQHEMNRALAELETQTAITTADLQLAHDPAKPLPILTQSIAAEKVSRS